MTNNFTGIVYDEDLKRHCVYYKGHVIHRSKTAERAANTMARLATMSDEEKQMYAKSLGLDK